MSLRIARKIAGVTQVGLAKKSGITQPLIARYESGQRSLTLAPYDTLKRLATALGLTVDELVQIVAMDPDRHDPTAGRSQGQRMRYRKTGNQEPAATK